MLLWTYTALFQISSILSQGNKTDIWRTLPVDCEIKKHAAPNQPFFYQPQYINKDMKHIYNALHIIILFLCRGLYTQYNANLGDGAKHYRISYFWIKNLKIVLETFTMTHFKAIVLYLMK